MTEQTTHHPFGPSSLERRFLCPWSAKAEHGLPEDENPYAASGTRIHEAAAKYITEDVSPKLEDVAEQEAAEAICWKWDQFRSQHEINTAQAERRLVYKQPWGDEIYHGTADVVVNTDDAGVFIIDWKTGRRQVADASDNWQGAGYALALMQECNLAEVSVLFFNPVARQETRALFNDMATLNDQITAAIAKCETATEEDARPGLSQCRYCKAAKAGVCKMFIREASLRLNAMNSPMSEWTDDQASSELDRVKAAEKYIEAVKAEVLRRAARNGGVCGAWKVRERLGARKVKDVGGLFGAVENVVSEPEFMSICTIPVGKLETLWAQKRKTDNPDAKVRDLKADFKTITEPFMELGPSTTELYKEDAP